MRYPASCSKCRVQQAVSSAYESAPQNTAELRHDFNRSEFDVSTPHLDFCLGSADFKANVCVNCFAQLDSLSAPDVSNVLPPEIIDMDTFCQLLEMDDEDDREFSKEIVWNFFEQANTTFKEMDDAL